MPKTRILTFGHKRGVPSSVDYHYDVRHVADEDHEAEQDEADKIAKDINQGDHVGIGCEHGQYTSVGIARLVKKHLEDAGHDVQVTHRDLKDEYVMHPLLKETDKHTRNENVRERMKRGMSEADAVKESLKRGKKRHNKKHTTLKQGGQES